jgi:ubiquinone/menaquinone biosynthesis C-methylase UbiE
MQATHTKGYKGMGMNGIVATWYAANTRKFLSDFEQLAHRVAQISPGPDVLEVAPGPGYFAIELAKQDSFRVTGLDISKSFVEIAQRNAAEANVRVDFRQGNAAAMPFESHSFDFILCRAAFKNFSEPIRALQEMERVLRVGGMAMIIDMRKDASQASIDETVNRMGGSWVNRTMNALTFRFVLLKRAYTRHDFEQFLAQTHFSKIDIREEQLGYEITLTK